MVGILEHSFPSWEHSKTSKSLLELSETSQNHSKTVKSIELAPNRQNQSKIIRIKSKLAEIDQHGSHIELLLGPFSLKIPRKNNVFFHFTIFPYDVILASHLDLRGVTWRHLWSAMAPYQAILGPSWADLVPFWSLLGPSWDVLEPPCGPLEASCCHPGISWAIWSPLGGHVGDFGSILDPFGPVLDSLWEF